MAGPTKLSPTRKKQICTHLAAGNSRRISAEAAGISRRTFQRWMAKGEEQTKGPFRAFRRAVIRAEAEAVTVAVGCIREAGKKNWRAAAWWLERRHPKDWGRWEQLRLSPGEAQPTEIVFRIGKGPVQASSADDRVG